MSDWIHAAGALPDSIQLASGARGLMLMFKSMSDRDILKWSAFVDEKLSAQHRAVGSHELADAFHRRAEAIRNILEKADERDRISDIEGTGGRAPGGTGSDEVVDKG